MTKNINISTKNLVNKYYVLLKQYDPVCYITVYIWEEVWDNLYWRWKELNFLFSASSVGSKRKLKNFLIKLKRHFQNTDKKVEFSLVNSAYEDDLEISGNFTFQEFEKLLSDKLIEILIKKT